MPTIVVARLLLESLESIGETSFNDVEINSRIDDSCNVAAVDGDETKVEAFWKTTKSSPGRVHVARRVEASTEKICRCDRVVRIDGESLPFGTLRILPKTQRQISHSDIGRDLGVARVEFLRSLRIGQRARPFTAAAVN